MNIPDPIPLYPTLNEIQDIDLSDYPAVDSFLDEDQGWRRQHWEWGFAFLKYIARNKSDHTYARFRSETEKFLLWAFLIKKVPMDSLRKSDVLEYADFCWKPPISWIALASADRFILINGRFEVNPQWRPFKMKRSKNMPQDQHLDRKKYRPSQETLTATFTAIIAFYKYLMYEEICYGNPAQVAKTDCRYFIRDAQIKEVRRLTEAQWSYVLEAAEELASKDPVYERSLFVIATLKVLFLRISELSERTTWSPSMKHFWQDDQSNWWLKIFGKGRKLRDVSVPTQFLTYLKRYRNYRALSPLPSPSDPSPIVEKLRGQGGMSSRHLTRIVQEVFDHAHAKMKAEHGEDASRKLLEASTHWLRHTGASMEIERGRALKDLSEDLGHASMATTDTVYVQSEHRKRAESGKTRKV